MMIVVHTTLPVGADGDEQLEQYIEELVAQSRSEDGTVRYRAMRDLTDPSLIRFVEQYEDADAAQKHTQSDAYRQFVEALPEAVDGTIETIQFAADDIDIAELTPTEAVAALD